MEKSPHYGKPLLPEAINSIIDSDLVLINEGHSSQTQRYTVPNYPYLLIRHNKKSTDFATISQTAKVFNELPRHGINSLPYIPVDHSSGPHVVTLKVEGEDLEDLLKRGDCSPELIDKIDRLWANLAYYLVYGNDTLAPIAADIYTPHQYMYGTVAGIATPQLWLVDLGEFTNTFRSEADKQEFGRSLLYYEYEGELLDLINATLEIEKYLESPLVYSRQALERATTKLSDPYLAGSFADALARSRMMRPMDYFPDSGDE